MPSQSDYPSSWANDCPQKGIRVEIAVSESPETVADLDEYDFTWIEIPTSEVELWEEKADGPHIKKTAKVTFPTRWDDRDVRDVVKGFGNDTPRYARLSVKDERGNWVLEHVGIVAGLGGTNNRLESKFWAYDMSYLFDAMGVTETYNNATVRNVIEDVLSTLTENLVPLTGAFLLTPNGDRLFLRDVEQLSEGSQPPERGSSYYGYDISEQDNELGDTNLLNLDIQQTPTFSSLPFADTLERAEEVSSPGDVLESIVTATFDIEDDPIESLGTRFGRWVYRVVPELGAKKFKGNRDTVRDVLNWLSKKTGLQYHFEPTQNGVTLVITGGPMRRTFVQDAVVEDLQRGDISPRDFQSQTDEYYAHETVTVRRNQALYEIAPANTVILKGDTKRSILGQELELDGTFPNVSPSLQRDYPVATAVAEPLVDVAGGKRLPLEIEADVTTLDEARQQAVVELQNHLDQSSEGEIRLDGMPRALPYDVIDAYETCGRYVTEQLPVRYEIETVKHTDDMTSTLETELNVQAFVGEESITTESRMETFENN